MNIDDSWFVIDPYTQITHLKDGYDELVYDKRMKIKLAYHIAYAFHDRHISYTFHSRVSDTINDLETTEILEDILVPPLGNVDVQIIEPYKIILIIPNKKREDIGFENKWVDYNTSERIIPTIMEEIARKQGQPLTNVLIVPTEETSFGIADEYDICDAKFNILHHSVKYDDLEATIHDNNYRVVSGEKYI